MSVGIYSATDNIRNIKIYLVDNIPFVDFDISGTIPPKTCRYILHKYNKTDRYTLEKSNGVYYNIIYVILTSVCIYLFEIVKIV